jgi:hypothetical protein
MGSCYFSAIFSCIEEISALIVAISVFISVTSGILMLSSSFSKNLTDVSIEANRSSMIFCADSVSPIPPICASRLSILLT